MNILITSGGTSEKIDRVRSITNHSTGRLGKIIAETFLDKGDQVTLVTTPKAVRPAAHPNLTIVQIENVAELLETLEPLVHTHDVLIHAMAVSDYTPVYMTGLEAVAASSDMTEFLNKTNSESKISSQDDSQVLFLKKTPKIISLVKKWNPDIRLIGFKLLVDVSKEELLETARTSLIKNQAEIIVANDLTDISNHVHKAYLVRNDTVTLAQSKEEIAQLLYLHIHSP
ncbi:phosphopantothenate-cysteine ligase [Streptococcus sanguinis SK1 = NCTC 7863]|jgi:phosphopantothenate--cysteine ligase|uniref:Phosphopantothenate-cysteine ligase n=2 Tax=Streptococcus sanguinis TaxID=1305 RepID=F2CD24_STRSA|nr:phosphopantothenate--cysteine ligase [Streptococcus sanguinis]EGC24798.1 phosphopantothenate--cysteine ligase [Streptococcus sanguinis SK405]EGC26395.1 phosphopantothenate--cysteine ligase [Streptococcus sanguinis SK678]EGF08512.1 phosphopantothenate-cysteine ligase [Streptococcus sanguinis SK1 = NCTC 7863]EGF19614.1 phosphopantothenate-cysteine ligase [Streptococcus sanguinis SK408]MBZ2074369.1 phosphopantothenate--cysteine ligase [Streptococcus sanguinis]